MAARPQRPKIFQLFVRQKVSDVISAIYKTSGGVKKGSFREEFSSVSEPVKGLCQMVLNGMDLALDCFNIATNGDFIRGKCN